MFYLLCQQWVSHLPSLNLCFIICWTKNVALFSNKISPGSPVEALTGCGSYGKAPRAPLLRILLCPPWCGPQEPCRTQWLWRAAPGSHNLPENSPYTVSAVLSGCKTLCSEISIEVFFNSYYHPKCYLMLETLFDSVFYFVTWPLHCKTDWSWTLKGMEQITK